LAVDDATLISSSALRGIVEHIPAELTVTVRAGTPSDELAAHLAAQGQWWPQADIRPRSTVGGIISAAASGRRRLRYGPVRDSLLEVVLVTGDGRIVRGGGPTVKGVAGYDLPRLMVGARGTLGFVTQVTLKLTPLPPARAWFSMSGDIAMRVRAARALIDDPRRPTAILLTPGSLHVELAGAADDVSPPTGFQPSEEAHTPSGAAVVDVGVPPTRLVDLVAQVEAMGLSYIAELGVGVCQVALNEASQLAALRAAAERDGGHAIVTDAPPEFRADPWGRLPDGVGIMDRMRQAFDPYGILSPAHRVGGTA
jgi:glycolate oxidase FAD binding subunit